MGMRRWLFLRGWTSLEILSNRIRRFSCINLGGDVPSKENGVRNTALVYLYRDAANYKEWGRVVFGGPIDDELRQRVTSALMSSENFVAEAVRVPQLFPYLQDGEDFDERYDHGWHEFHEFEDTDEPVDDEASRSIREFVTEVEQAAAGGWNVSDPQEILSGIQL